RSLSLPSKKSPETVCARGGKLSSRAAARPNCPTTFRSRGFIKPATSRSNCSLCARSWATLDRASTATTSELPRNSHLDEAKVLVGGTKVVPSQSHGKAGAFVGRAPHSSWDSSGNVYDSRFG